jgi:hypothetical protein
VADQHELRVGLVGLRAPALQPDRSLLGEAVRGLAVVATPVVGEVEPVLAVDEVESPLQDVFHLRVAVDLPEAGHEVDVGHEPRRGDPVAEVGLLGVVAVQLEVLDAPAERREASPDGALGKRPHVLSFALQHASEDPWEQHNDIADGRAAGHGALRTP